MGSRFIKFLHRVLGGRPESPITETAGTVNYKGYLIRAAPRVRGSEWTTEGMITKQFAGSAKEHYLIRVDIHGDKDEAITFCIARAKQIIDEQGDRMFDGHASVSI